MSHKHYFEDGLPNLDEQQENAQILGDDQSTSSVIRTPPFVSTNSAAQAALFSAEVGVFPLLWIILLTLAGSHHIQLSNGGSQDQLRGSCLSAQYCSLHETPSSRRRRHLSICHEALQYPCLVSTTFNTCIGADSVVHSHHFMVSTTSPRRWSPLPPARSTPIASPSPHQRMSVVCNGAALWKP